MSRRYVNTLIDGETIDEVFLLADKQLRVNRNADLFLLAQLRDRTGQVSALLWNVDEEDMAPLQAGQYVRVRGKAQLYQGNLQLILTSIQRVSDDTIDQEEFVQETSVETGVLFTRLTEIVATVKDPEIRGLLEAILDDSTLVDGLMRAPAGVRMHHAYPGGLLEHVVGLLEAGLRIVDLYPTLDRSLLVAGIILHDIGKVRELGFETTLNYTDQGQLVGHIVIGVEIVNEKLPEVELRTGQPMSEETVLRIKHMILSHHGTYEFGSPRLPMTPEAIALHHLDNLDAKLNEFASLMAADPNSGSPWTPFAPHLQRKLFKGAPRP
ncbi:MAG: HD domain-containing protein [Planctomycetaceae bacterium]